jgi:hypothetical protein
MVGTGSASEATTHLQYYLSTEYGGWALWVTCAESQVADLDASIAAMSPPLT